MSRRHPGPGREDGSSLFAAYRWPFFPFVVVLALLIVLDLIIKLNSVPAPRRSSLLALGEDDALPVFGRVSSRQHSQVRLRIRSKVSSSQLTLDSDPSGEGSLGRAHPWFAAGKNVFYRIAGGDRSGQVWGKKTALQALGFRGAKHDTGDMEMDGDSPESSSEIALESLRDKVHGEKTAVGVSSANMPTVFDWQVYLMYYPELRLAGIETEEQALHHYLTHGILEGRLPRRVRTVLRYTACNGLINQLYCHITAISLATTIGAELILPPAAQRSSFADVYSLLRDQNTVSWSPAPLEGLFDVEKLIDYWKGKGLTITKALSEQPFPDMGVPDAAFQNYPMPGFEPDLHIRISGLFLRNLEMPQLADMMRQAVVNHGSMMLRRDPNRSISAFVIDLPCPLFTVSTRSIMPLITEVARSIRFAPAMQQMADDVLGGMRSRYGVEAFNGLHLRIEKDALDWTNTLGGPQAVWNMYLNAMRGTGGGGFNATTGVYVACGLLTYNAGSEFKQYQDELVGSGLTDAVYFKEMFLAATDMAMLTSEQKALIDFLVLAKSRYFVGMGSSTFSFYIREYRALLGGDPATVSLLDSSRIGTDPLFAAAAHVV